MGDRDLDVNKLKGELELNEYGELIGKLKDMIDKMNNFSKGLKSKDAVNEYKGGFSLRILLLNESIFKIITIAPPTRAKQLTLDEYCELNVNFHGFHLHLFGALENLAWIWFHEKNDGKYLTKNDSKTVVSLFKEKFVDYFNHNDRMFKLHEDYKDWHMFFSEYRDPTVHRIPMIVSYMYRDGEKLLVGNINDKNKPEEFYKLVYMIPYSVEETWGFFHKRNILDMGFFLEIIDRYMAAFN